MGGSFREFLTRNVKVKLGEVCDVEDAGLREDGFRITVSRTGRAELRYHGANGKRYAREALGGMTEGGVVPIAEVEDYPSFALRGIIEGFYGRPYTDGERRELIDFLCAHRMNAYFYAPKDDTYHRERWRIPYPEEKLRELGELCRYATERGIRFYYCLSPGKDFRYTDGEDDTAILNKYRQLADAGVSDFAILFDDIPAELTAEEKAKFASAAEAHCHVANEVNRRIPHKHPLVFCPTDYFQNTDTPYRKGVREKLDSDVWVFWTGYNTVAEVIPEEDCVTAAENFRHPLVLWDNYPVNDYPPKERVYLGAVCNRTRKIAQYHAGCIANPSELWQSSKVALSTMAEWMWNAESYDEEAAYGRAVKEQLGEGEEVRFFADLNRASPLKTYPTIRPLLDAGEWEKLDGYYLRAEESARYVEAHWKKELKDELKELIRAVLLECRLYAALRKGQDLEPLLSELQSCALRPADKSLFAYIAEHGLGRDITFPDREVCWKREIFCEDKL